MSFDLNRFLTAQDPVYPMVCTELAAGRKTSHWMWFVFPQLRELGRSQTARFFGIDGAHEAAAYWHHPVLGDRLRHCAQLVLDAPEHDIHRFFGSPDDLKLCSCMTLFEATAPGEAVFQRVLALGFQGVRDSATLALLRSPQA